MSLTPSSFSDRIIAGKGHLIHKLTAKDATGQWACYFLLVEPARERAFLEALAQKRVSDLEAYGRIIASCYGETPTQAVKTLLHDKYGFEI